VSSAIAIFKVPHSCVNVEQVSKLRQGWWRWAFEKYMYVLLKKAIPNGGMMGASISERSTFNIVAMCLFTWFVLLDLKNYVPMGGSLLSRPTTIHHVVVPNLSRL
jgi:hypothetical protein